MSKKAVYLPFLLHHSLRSEELKKSEPKHPAEVIIQKDLKAEADKRLIGMVMENLIHKSLLIEVGSVIINNVVYQE